MSRLGSSLLVRIGLSLGLVALILWWAGGREVAALLAQASVAGIAAVILLHSGDRLLMAYKWHRLLRVRDLDIGLGEAVRAYYISSFAGVFLPMTVGADLVRIGALQGGRVSNANLVASIAIERGLGALSQAVFCVMSVLLIAAFQLQVDVPVGGLLALAAATVATLTLALPLSFRLAAFLAARWREHGGFVGKLGKLAHEYSAWRDHPREIWVFLLLTFLEGFFPIVTYVAAAWALGVPATLLEMTAVVPIVYLVARLPISVAGIGFEQGGFVLAAGLLGIADEAAATAVTFLVLLALLVALLPGAIGWIYTRRSQPLAG